MFTAPILGVEFIIYPTLAILPTFYASLGGRNLTEYGTALLISRSVYSWSGPLVGYLSDRIATPWGRRKPWMLAGLIVALVSVVFLFHPPHDAGPFYFACASTLALASFSLIDIPYIAWGSEITRDPAERSRIAGWRMSAALGALLLFLGLPYVPIFGGTDLLDPVVIGRLGIVAFVTVALAVALCLRFGPPTIPDLAVPQRAERALHVLRHIAMNRPFRYVAGATFLSYLSISVMTSVQFAFLASLGIVKQYGIVVIVSTLAAAACMPAWTWAAKRLGKCKSWSLGLALSALSAATYFALAPFTSPLVAVLVSSVALNAASVVQFMPYAAVGDAIDYDELRSGVNHSANYTALLLVLIRLTTAVGGAIAFYALGASGFQIGATNAPAAQNGMLLTYFGVPAVLYALALGIAAAYPLTERRHAIVARRLERRRRVAARGTNAA